MPKAKTVKRDKELQKGLDEYRKHSDMPIDHAVKVVNGIRMKHKDKKIDWSKVDWS